MISESQNKQSSTNNLQEVWQSPNIELQYRLMMETIEDYAILLLDTGGHVVTWNKGAQKLKQYQADEAIGQQISIFYPPDAIAQGQPEKDLEEAFRYGRWQGQGWRLRKDGTAFWTNVTLTALFQDDGRHLGFSYMLQDLTQQRMAEVRMLQAYHHLEESESRYRLLVEGVTDYAIFMLNSSGHVVTWNEGARRLKGYEAEEIIGQHFSRFYPQAAKDINYPETELAEARRLGRFEDEGWRLRKDGSAFWANVIITAIFNSKGELNGFSKITRDLTERKQLEEKLYRANAELRESEEKNRLLIDSVKDYAILMLNPAGEIVSWNAGAERIKGYQAKEIIGKNFSIFYTPEAISSGFPQYELSKALQDGRFEDEGWRLRKDGTAFWANVVITAIFDSNHRHIGFSKITRDLTEKIKNAELMRKNQELLRLNRDLDNFVYTASHDLKSPIANLEGLISELKEDMGADQQKYGVLLTWIDEALLSLKKVVGDLAEVTRVDQQNYLMELVDLEALFGEVKESLREQIANRQVKVVADFSAVPALPYSRKNLRSILFNLVSNAVKYSDASKSAEVRVSTQYLANERAVLLSVSDNGLGIPDNQKDKIFSMFRRYHTHVEGSGVGLYLVKKILENQGDRIEVESHLNAGSTFRVYFYQR